MKFNIRNTFYILFGNFLLALAVGYFILPYNILSGGVAGIAVALHSFILIPTDVMVNALVVGLFFVGWILLGKDFAVKTVVSSFIYPIFLSLTAQFLTPPANLDPILASLYGGLIAGVGIGLVIRTGSSTGGMDIPPLVIHKYTNIPIAKLILITDCLTVLLGLFAYNLETVLVGIISVFATSFAIDKVLVVGGQESKSVQIISADYEKISATIHERLDRGTTITKARGGYTNDEKNVILAVVSQGQYPQLIDIVNEIDPKAFIITTDTTDVHGEGFSFGYRV
ncbi:YitT family protein [Anaerorhabdus sp.]|uniref:YitT family protein n=1 Tax=Anaerorhabdus sp. TaxID=1872524 RepID=UPI002FC8126F